MKKCEIREAHRREITEYVADLEASQSREVILTTELETVTASYRLHTERLRVELGKANRAWSAARAAEATAKAQLVERTRDRDTVAGDRDRVQAELDRKLRECADLGAQLSRIRVAHEQLRRAVYPTLQPPPFGSTPPLTGIMWNQSPPVYTGANYDFTLQDKVDRLDEAGYSCATGKRDREAREAVASYAGLR